MPILTDSSHSSDWIEPDEVPRPVVSYGIASTDIGGIELASHAHEVVLEGALRSSRKGVAYEHDSSSLRPPLFE